MRVVECFTAWLALAAASAGAMDEPPFPGGWNADLSASQYRIGLDSEIRHGGKSAAFIEPRVALPQPPANGSLLQTINARDYRGKRLRFAAFVKTTNLDRWAELWTLVWRSSPDSSDSAAAPAIKENTDWARHAVEFLVADDAVTIECGLRLVAGGRAWIDDASLEIVGKADDTVAKPNPGHRGRFEEPPPGLPSRLENGDFEQSKPVYDLALAQGLWELEGGKFEDPHTVRETRLIAGNKATVTCYDKTGRICSQSTTEFSLGSSGRVSLMTHRNLEFTAGLSKGAKAPPGVSTSNVYSVNHSRFTEIRGAVDGSGFSPVVQQWKRVEGEPARGNAE